MATNPCANCLTDMKTLKSIFSFAVIAVVFANVVAPAQVQTPGLRQQLAGAGERFFPALNRVLTDDQRQSFRAVIQPQFGKIQPIEEKVRTARKALLDEIAAGKFDEAAVRQSAEDSAKAETELTVIFAKALSQIQPPLSAQQIEQLKNFQPGQGQQQPQSAPQAEVSPRPKMNLPPPLPRDANDLPVVPAQK
jgi:Spy/CpxP family protein refolding chaperone